MPVAAAFHLKEEGQPSLADLTEIDTMVGALPLDCQLGNGCSNPAHCPAGLRLPATGPVAGCRARSAL